MLLPKAVLKVLGPYVLLSALFIPLVVSTVSSSKLISSVYAASSLPSFGLGLASSPGDGWMTQTGIPWSYSYQYLAGNVNGGNWDSWNPNGTFALNYANEKSSAGYIPFFSYYVMCQSNGCGSNEHLAYIGGLNSVSNMKNYFANFTELMERLGIGSYDGIQGFGKLAVVQIEPDFSGNAEQAVLGIASCYGYCGGEGNDPSLLRAAVSSTGNPDVANFPNTYAGYNQALAHIRDLYAPNVLLAFHVSDWATGTDIGQSHDTNLDTNSLGSEAGTFAKLSGFSPESGASSFDLITSDPLDRDAAYYKLVLGNPNAWWNRQNTTFPNFQRYEGYIGAVHQLINKPVIIWQIPIGNQYFDSENNTNNHYQDNRIEYFLGQNLDFSSNHIQELKNVGVTGLLFGAGAGGQSSNLDSAGDGITNPNSICVSDGLSSGQICNNHRSSYSDDDGGYLRLMAARFYVQTVSTPPSPTPSPSITPTPSPTPSPAQAQFQISESAAPNPVTLSAATTISTSVTSTVSMPALVDIEIYSPGGTKVFQRYFDNQNLTANRPVSFTSNWNTASLTQTGTYMVDVGIFNTGWNGLLSWQTPGQVNISPKTALSIYTDFLASGWANWSWNSSLNYSNTNPVYSGADSIAFTAQGAWAGLYLHSNNRINTGGFSTLHFEMQASTTNQRYSIQLEDSNNSGIESLIPLANLGGDPAPGSWTSYNIPLSSLGGSNRIISGIIIQESTGHPQPPVFVDDISLAN